MSGRIFGVDGTISSRELKIGRVGVRICPDLSRFFWIGPEMAQFGQILCREFQGIAGLCGLGPSVDQALGLLFDMSRHLF